MICGLDSNDVNCLFNQKRYIGIAYVNGFKKMGGRGIGQGLLELLLGLVNADVVRVIRRACGFWWGHQYIC